MDLSEFLLARLGEDEAAAQAVADEHQSEDWDSYMSSAGFYGRSAHTFAQRFDPARVLAECDAKRRIVEDFGTASATLTALALPYADHPDYDKAWRP